MVKKIKVLTAIGNENLNNILKNQNEFEILENDIFYKEGNLKMFSIEILKNSWCQEDSIVIGFKIRYIENSNVK